MNTKQIISTIITLAIVATAYNIVNDLWRGYSLQHLNKIQVERCSQNMQANPSLVCD